MPGHSENSARQLELRTLGVTGLYSSGADRPLLGPGKPFALLTYVALTPGRRASRETLTDLLWADLDPERARRALRQSLFQLRRVVGEEVLLGNEELALSTSLGADRDAFLAAVERDDLPEALATYGGEFLPNFGVPGGAAFEQWADLERGRLQTSFIRAGELLVRRHLNRGEAREGRRLARVVRDRAPGDEAAWRLVLEVAVSTRDFVAAGTEAAALEEWAVANGIAPGPATRAALTRARQLAPPAEHESRAVELVAELTGREREFHAITAAWDAVRTGKARHIHLRAAAGLGKTRLLQEAFARLVASGARVVSLRGTPGDRDVPYAFAADLAAVLASLPGAAGIAPASAATLLALNPTLSASLAGVPEAVPGDEVMRRRILALADLVHAVAHEQRVALAIDDVHWLDAPSLRVLEGLLARVHDARVLCVTAARPELRFGDERTMTLPLVALHEAQVGALIAALGALPVQDDWPARFVAGVHAASGGSPLLVLETLRLALDDGALVLEQGAWRCVDDRRLTALLQAGGALRARLQLLPTPSRGLLGLLATAGTPLDDAAVAALQRVTVGELPALLGPLEQQGFVMRTTAGWMPAHDEIADAARATLDEPARASTERALADYLAREAGGDPLSLMRAAHHARQAGQPTLVAQLFLRYAQRARLRGDARHFAVLAAEFGAADDAMERRLAAAIPWQWRLGLWSRTRRRAAVAATLAFATFAGSAAWVRHARDASLPRLFYADSTGVVRMTRVHAEAWDGRTASVGLTRDDTPLGAVTPNQVQYPPAVSPDGRSVVWTQDAGDSTTFDLWIRTPAGTRRLTHEPRDDIAHQWLPDGSGIVGTTNRWSPRDDGDYDVAVFDTGTGTARQITHGHPHDTSPRASPDGTRIALLRESDAQPSMLCVVSLDGVGEPDCRLVNGRSVGEIVGWSGPDELVLVLIDGIRRPLVLYEWTSERTTELLAPWANNAHLSPDRRWMVVSLRRDGVRGARDWIVPLDAPARARPVDAGATGMRWWEGADGAPPLITRLEFADTLSTLPFGIASRLQVRSLTGANAEVPLHVPVRWSSGDSSIAVVDSTGEVRPRGTGQVTITASVAGRHSVSRIFSIRGAPSTTLLTERWDDTWRQRWLPWGEPVPSVRTGPGGVRGFANNGDGTFVSMAVLRRALSARQGLGVELRVSTPITRLQWQRLRVALAAGIDTAALVAGDQRRGAPSLGRFGETCGFNFPQPGALGATSVGLSSGVGQSTDIRAVAPAVRDGHWWTLRLQLLPDGRCGFAINRRVIWLSPEPIPLDGEFRVRLGDESNGTTILHGPLEIWSGVRTDVDWSKRP